MESIIEKYGFKEGLSTRDFNIIEWPYEGVPVPSRDEVLAIEEAWCKRNEYKRLRSIYYPSIQDQLDMIFHDIDNWREVIQSIKNVFPKPPRV